MPKYKVTLEEISTYEIDVEAADEQAAGDEAEKVFVNSDNVDQYFVCVEQRDTVDVEEMIE